MRKGTLAYEIVMTALVLVVIAGVAGALLGFVHDFTAIDEDELFTRKASAVYEGELMRMPVHEGISQAEEGTPGVLGVYIPKDTSVQDVYVLHVLGLGAYKGALELLVNITDGRIVKVAKYEANETPGLGSKALEDSYFEQYYNRPIDASFSGYTLVKSAPASDGEVRAVSGASKSSTAVTQAINAAANWYKNTVWKGEAE